MAGRRPAPALLAQLLAVSAALPGVTGQDEHQAGREAARQEGGEGRGHQGGQRLQLGLVATGDQVGGQPGGVGPGGEDDIIVNI